MKRFLYTEQRYPLLLAVILFILFIPNKSSSQDPEFSQFYSAPLNVNPAYAGITLGPRIIINYRNQWPSLDNASSPAFVTYAVSYDQHFDALSGGIGLMILSDKAGEGLYTATTISGMYSHELRPNRHVVIKNAIQAKYVQKKLDWDAVLLSSMINLDGKHDLPPGDLKPPNTSISYADVRVGSVIYTEIFFGGLAVDHLLPNKESYYNDNTSKVPLRIAGHGGATIKLSRSRKENFFVSPNLIYIYQSRFQQVNLGGYINRRGFSAGMWFKHTVTNIDALTFLVAFSKSIFKIGYSYDLTVSSLGTNSGGAHEFSLILNFAEEGSNYLKRRTQTPIPSPVFF